MHGLVIPIDNMKKDILPPSKFPAKRLADTTVTPQAEYFIKFSRSERKLCLGLHYNGRNSLHLLPLQK